ncbi:MAG: DUF1203 domain-containing protein [Pseudomonadota bacterium]
MTFQIHPLDPAPFADLFDLSDEELASRDAVRMISDKPVGFPCRVSLEDAAPGEELILCNYAHQEEATPYAASHAIFVKRGAEPATPAPGETPEVLRRRVLSVRAFDADHMMIAGDVAAGDDLGDRLDAAFADAAVEYVHIHFAGRGCFAAKATRA